MTNKATYTIPVIWKPDDENVTSKQIATSGREVSHIKLVASGSAATVELYDNADGNNNPTDLKWVMDSSTTSTDRDAFSHPIVFKKGIYAVLVSGQNANPILCLSVFHDQV